MPGYCGDGIVNGTDQCDDGNQVNVDGCLNSCVIASCGDGFIQSGVEACDDGNTVTGDFCDANCEIDTDGDGLNDNDEINIYNTSPNNPDSDNDGLNDGVEVNSLGTDPTLNDTDGNGIPDGDEDFDADGFTNLEEIACESDPTDSSSGCTKGLPWLMLLLD
jgi:cysteine-rich repeat protein